jgi:hypothetical protein
MNVVQRRTKRSVTACALGASLALLGACAVVQDPQTYAEAALREDAREAALAPAVGPDADDPPRLDTAAVAQALGRAGRLRGGVYQIQLRQLSSGETAAPATVVLDATLALHPIGGGDAALTGNVVLPLPAVAATVRALGSHGISVTSVERASGPRGGTVATLHVWAVGDAATLARGLHGALDTPQPLVATR